MIEKIADIFRKLLKLFQTACHQAYNSGAKQNSIDENVHKWLNGPRNA